MDQDAASGVFAFLIAGGLFLALVGGILLTTKDVANDPGQSQRAVEQVSAQGIVDVLVASAGHWDSGVDNVDRLGLLNANGSGLDPATLALMRGGVYDATANGVVDYDEARASLGLDENQDMHIRVYPPSLVSYLDALDLSHIQTAYIGSWLNIDSDNFLPLDPATVQAQAQASVDDAMEIITSSERDAIVTLGTDFKDDVYLDHLEWDLEVMIPLLPDIPVSDYMNTTLLDGDVYPDDKNFLNEVIPARLDGYDLLIVGSGVDQSSMTSNVVKDKIRDWVLAGGTLMVLGSDSQNFQWLQPLFQVGTSTVNGGSYAPDVDHPMLHQPNELAWTDYDNHGLGWDIKDTGNGAHYDDFSHIIVEDSEDVLAVSLPGAFGDGRVYLTTFRPGDIAEEISLQEAIGFIENMVIYDDRADLYLDFGPSVPEGQSVTAAVRTSHIWDDDIGQVPVRVEVLYWSN